MRLRTIIFFSCIIVYVCAVPKESFYPYKQEHGDRRLEVGDDVSSEEFQLDVPIAFYDDYFSSVYINNNGHVTFETELPAYQSDLVLPMSYKMIAPFLADVETTITGSVYYRETKDPSLLDKVTQEIHVQFPDKTDFQAYGLFIVTWDGVGYFDRQYEQTNTFQLVIASDRFDSFVFFLYADDGVQWIRSQGKHSPIVEDVPAQAGFDAGDNRRYYRLPPSGNEQARNLAVWSNFDRAGAWLFHIGNTHGGNIGYPGDGRPVGGTAGSNAKTCAEGGRHTCNSNAYCEDTSTGFCCKCDSGFFGNGVNCIKQGAPQRVNGKLHGNINGLTLDGVDIHAYVVTSDGRPYTAISRVPATVGFPMQSLYTIGGILGWMFAIPQSPRAKNGFQLTGGDANRTATVRYMAGGETVEIRQSVQGQDALGYMRMSTNINGNIPSIAPGARVEVVDYTEEYSRVAPGRIKSLSTHTYQVDGVPYRFTLDQTITFKECSAQPLDELPPTKLSVNKNFVVHGEEEEIVRYATTNRISVAGADPCRDVVCGHNADCVAHRDSHRCVCREGYEGDGTRCRDIDECAHNTHDCDVNAHCYNRDGSYDCECMHGFHGDGRSCQPEPSYCGDLVCDSNAQCVVDEATKRPTCQCLQGYFGDGRRCQMDTRDSCNVRNNCDRNARCVLDHPSGRYMCVCNSGYRGDGYDCESESCDVLHNCDTNARCLFDSSLERYACLCNPGYAGDGFRCVQESCDFRNLCDVNAECVYDHKQRSYMCQCNDGWEGDGRTCTQTPEACNQIHRCDINAECLYDPESGGYFCRCRAGYTGDGYVCRLDVDCRRDPGLCDINAHCQRRGGDHVCVCNEGYQGDGQRCGPMDRDTFLMYAQGVSIMQMHFPSQNKAGKQTLLIPGQTAIGIDVDCYARYFYWTDVSGKTISRAKLDGTDSEVLVKGLGSPEGVAVDWISKNIYWTDSGLGRIEVSRMDGSNRKTVFDTGLVNPRAIMVDPIKGLLFWTDWNRKAPKVASANMDGSNRKVIVRENLGLPNGLTIDYGTEQVCWADAGTMKIECATYTGQSRRVIYAFAPYPFDLTFADNVFYWTDWEMRGLQNMNLYADTPNEPLDLPVGGNGRLYGITTVRRHCPPGSNACSLNNGGCRFLCLPSPNGGRTCACPDDIPEDECNRIGILV